MRLHLLIGTSINLQTLCTKHFQIIVIIEVQNIITMYIPMSYVRLGGEAMIPALNS